MKALEVPKLSMELGLKESKASRINKVSPDTINDKIFKTNSSFHVK